MTSVGNEPIERALLLSVKVVLALVLLTPLIVMADPLPNTFFPFIVGKALYAHTLTEIAFGLWVVLILRYTAHRAPRSWLIIIFGVYVVVALLASIFGVSPQRSLWSTYERMQGFVDLAHWFAFTVVLTSVYRSWDDWRALLNFNLGVGFFFGLLGLSQKFDVSVLRFLETADRLDITLGNPTYVGAYMLVSVLIAAGLLAQSFMRPAQQTGSRALERRRKRGRRRQDRREVTVSWEIWWRVFWVAAILLYLWILYLSGTRGAVIGLGAGIVAFAAGYALWGRMAQLRMAALIILGTVFGLALILLLARNTTPFERLAASSVMLTRIADTGINDDSLRGRINSGLVGLRGFAARPILGWGPENFTIAYDRHVTGDIVASASTSFDQAHNKLIEELTTKGVLGFLGYSAIWAYMAWVVVRRIREQGRQEQVFTLFVGAALTGYFVQNLFLFDTPGTVVWYIVLLGYVVYLETSSQTERAEEDSARAREVSGWRFALGGRMGIVRSNAAYAAVIVAAALYLFLAIYVINVRAYSGAATVLKTLDRSMSWEQRLDVFEDSITAFPALANYPRIVMFNQLSNNFGSLTQKEAILALQAAEREGRDALEAEPQEWRIHVGLASLYHKAAAIDPEYIKKARGLVEEASRLAPERLETVRLVVLQHMAERDYEGAQATIDEYVKRNAAAAPHFQGLSTAIDNAAKQ